jgi:hypothetical protein
MLFSHPKMVLLILLLHLSLWCLQSGEWLVLGSSFPCTHPTVEHHASTNLPFLCFLDSEVTTQELFCKFYTKGFNQFNISCVIIFSFKLSCVCLSRDVSFLNSFNHFQHAHHQCSIFYCSALLIKLGCASLCFFGL